MSFRLESHIKPRGARASIQRRVSLSTRSRRLRVSRSRAERRSRWVSGNIEAGCGCRAHKLWGPVALKVCRFALCKLAAVGLTRFLLQFTSIALAPEVGSRPPAIEPLRSRTIKRISTPTSDCPALSRVGHQERVQITRYVFSPTNSQSAGSC